MFRLLFLTLLFFNSPSGAQEPSTTDQKSIFESERLPLSSVITELPNTAVESLKFSFSKESLPYWGLILSSTAVLYAYDEPILYGVQDRGRKWGIGNDDHTAPLFNIGPWDVRFPTDKGSTMYFLGDGITHMTIAGSLLGYGYFSENSRPYNTGLQLFHGMVISTFFSQLLKRSFGRESPVRKTEYRGDWDFFPTYTQYGDNTAKYDAMPSGHIMTATLTFTVLIENYPEYAYWLRPVEVTWLTVLGLQMVNNGVHWASDYPLGIGMGYVFGKMSARLGKEKKNPVDPEKISWQVLPSMEHGVLMTNLMLKF